MLTHCPACETHFRVTAEQLKTRSGRVRCGECQHVFNALDSLIEEPVLVVAPLTPAPPPQSLAAAFPDTVAEAPEELSALQPEEQEPSIPDSAEAAEPELAEPEAAEPDVAEPEATEPEATELEVAEPKAEEPEAVEPEAVPGDDADASDWSETFPEPPPPPRRWPWVIGSLVGLTAIGLQAVLAFRAELAVLWPEARPALVALCDIAGCEVGLPAKVAMVGIEASDLHPDTGQPGRLTLTATLKNRAPFAQQFPHLELTLTDTADKAIARKVLAPADYLPPATPFAQGMQANADIAVAVGVDPGELTASGYRLYLFYP